MKTLLLSLLLLVSASACEKDPPSDTPPRLLGLSMAGVPPQNITLDEPNKRITVLLPAVLPSLRLNPTYQLSPGTVVLGGEIDLAQYCPCYGSTYIEGEYKLPIVLYKADGGYQLPYEVHFKPAQPLRLLASAKPIEIQAILDQTQDHSLSLYLPAEYANVSAPIMAISVSKVGQEPNWIGASDACFNLCPAVLNQVGISLYGYWGTGALLAGEYAVRLQLADGSPVVELPQSIRIK